MNDININNKNHRMAAIEKQGSTFSKSTSVSSNLTAHLKNPTPSQLQLQLQQQRKRGLVKSSSSKNLKNSSNNQEQMRLIKESKAAKTLAIVVGGFVVSWMPFFIVYVLEAILPRGYISKMLFDWLTWLGYFNSAINPIIYAFYSKQFRSAFYRLTLGKFSSSKEANKKLFANHSNNYYYSMNHVNGINGINGNKTHNYSFYNNNSNGNKMNYNVGQRRGRRETNSFYRDV